MEIIKCNNGDTLGVCKDGGLIYKRKIAKKNRVCQMEDYRQAKAVALEIKRITDTIEG